MFTIIIRFEHVNSPLTLKGIKPGQTILEICLNNKIELNHICAGACACTPCHIYIDSGNNNFERTSRREFHFIERGKKSKINSRLACQCVLTGRKGKIEITLPDQAILPQD